MDWPWQYSFPPFFTIQVSGPGLVIYSLPNKSTADNNFLTQPHSATKAKQLEAWRHLVLNYCQVESAVSSQEMKTKISRFIQYLSLIWLTLETCPCFITQAYREDCQPRQISTCWWRPKNHELPAHVATAQLRMRTAAAAMHHRG